MQKIDIKNIRQMVCDRLNVDTTNISLNAKMGKGSIKVFNSFIMRAMNGEPFYSFVPKEAVRHSQGDWEYDISSFKIYKFTKESLIELGFDSDIIKVLNSSDMLSLMLSDDYIVYDSKEGTILQSETKTEFTLREKACLYLSLPESGTKWLDDLIMKKNKNVLLKT